MLPSPRIPAPANDSFKAMSDWFGVLYSSEMLFHPDDPPEHIYWNESNIRAFTDVEAEILRGILEHLFVIHGDSVYEAAYPYFMDWMHGSNWKLKTRIPH